MKTTNEIVFDLLDSSKTLWSVEKQPLFTASGIKTESFGVIRKDNGQWLGTVKDQYQPMQNQDLAQTIVEAAAGIGENFRGGLLQGGRKVYYQVALPDHNTGTDTIKRHITALNSHDGSTSIGFGSSNTVVICQNTFYRAMKDVSKFRHTISAAGRIDAAAAELRRVLVQDTKLMESFDRMAEKKIQKPIFEAVISNLFKTDIDVKKDDISGRKANQMQAFNRVLESELASHGETLWGLFNAVTYYENHVTVKEDKKLESIFLGGGSRAMNSTYDQIMEWIEANTAELVPVNM